MRSIKSDKIVRDESQTLITVFTVILMLHVSHVRRVRSVCMFTITVAHNLVCNT